MGNMAPTLLALEPLDDRHPPAYPPWANPRHQPPLAAAPAEPLYLVTYDYRDRAIGRCTGTADLSLNRQSRREVAEQIARGLIPGAERVFECVPGERCTDISEDVARDAMGLALQQFEPLDGDLLDFLERHLGCRSVPRPAGSSPHEVPRPRAGMCARR